MTSEQIVAAASSFGSKVWDSLPQQVVSVFAMAIFAAIIHFGHLYTMDRLEQRCQDRQKENLKLVVDGIKESFGDLKRTIERAMDARVVRRQ